MDIQTQEVDVWVHISALPFTGYVILGKFLKLMLKFCICTMEIIIKPPLFNIIHFFKRQDLVGHGGSWLNTKISWA